MAQPVILTYPIADTALMAATQDVTGGTPMILNGSSPYTPIPTGPLTLWQMERILSVSSPDNINGVTFTFVGTKLGGVPVVDTVTGVNNDTVETAEQFNTLISVTPDLDATNVSIGTGNGATFEWQIMDPYRSYAQYSFQGVVGGTISYSVLQTLDKIQNPPTSITGFVIDDSVMTPFTANTFFSFSYPITGMQLIVNSAGTDETGTLSFTILQQGVR